MSPLLQHILVLALVAGCVTWVGYQALLSLRGKRSRVGSCCAKGCDPAAATDPKKPAGERIVFLPSDALRRKK